MDAPSGAIAASATSPRVVRRVIVMDVNGAASRCLSTLVQYVTAAAAIAAIIPTPTRRFFRTDQRFSIRAIARARSTRSSAADVYRASGFFWRHLRTILSTAARSGSDSGSGGGSDLTIAVSVSEIVAPVNGAVPVSI